MGEKYIDTAFQTANKADPDALLFINEWGLEGSIGDTDTERWDTFLALIDRLLARGVPIHGVGFQAHVDYAEDMIELGVMRDRMRQLAKRGLLVRISEIDVTGDDPDAQAKQFADVLKACLDEANCIAYSTWGIGEGNGATVDVDGGTLNTYDSLPFDKELKPRQPVAAMQQVLSQ